MADPEPRSVRTPPDQAELPLSPSCGNASSGALEVGHVPASSTAVRRYRAERIDRVEVADFADAESAIRWCGVELSWVHMHASPGRTILIGSNERGRACATVTGPLLAILPECCKVEVL